MNTQHAAMPEGEEPPPPGVKVMAWVRWLMIGGLALVALYSVRYLMPAPPTTNAATKVAEAPRKYQCPMHPQVVRDEPGSCPICGMDLVLIAPAKSHAREDSLPELTRVELSSDRVQKLGVRTVTAQEKSLSESVRTIGVLAPSESRTAEVHTRFSGWVEETLVRETGAYVRKGDPLVRLYSPEVLQAWQDQKAANAAPKGDPLSEQIQKAARQRLQILGLDAEDVSSSEGSRPTVTLRAPRDGYITQKNAVDGLYIQPGTPLYEVSDLSVIWLMVDIHEDVLSRVSVGQKVVVTFPALPAVRTEARITYLYPAIDVATRTLKARVELQNPKLLLKTGLAANVELLGAATKGVMVPTDAVVQTGRSTYVFVRVSDGVFEPRSVTLGQQGPQETEIRVGVKAGEDVVTGALFLLDSESRLRASTQSARSDDGEAHDHSHH